MPVSSWRSLRDGEGEEEDEDESDLAGASFFLSACLASCLSAPCLAESAVSRLRLAVP